MRFTFLPKVGRILLAAAFTTASVLPVPALAAQRPVSGVVAVTTGILQARHTDMGRTIGRDVDTGGAIFLNDEVETDKRTKAQILLKDQSVFTIGANSRILFDEFVYDPAERAGAMKVNISSGVFRFISGKIAKNDPQKMSVQVGQATIGVRGTEVVGTVTEEGTSLVLLSGAIDVETAQGAQSIIKSGWGVTVTPAGDVTPPQPVPDTELRNLFDALSTKDDSDTAEEEAPEETEETAQSDEAADEPAEEEQDETAETEEAEGEEAATEQAASETEADTETDSETEAEAETESDQPTEQAAAEEPAETEPQAEQAAKPKPKLKQRLLPPRRNRKPKQIRG